MDKYLYKIGISLIDDNGNVIRNWSSKNVIAKDAQDAIKRARLGKKFIAEEVTEIARVDVQ